MRDKQMIVDAWKQRCGKHGDNSDNGGYGDRLGHGEHVWAMAGGHKGKARQGGTRVLGEGAGQSLAGGVGVKCGNAGLCNCAYM